MQLELDEAEVKALRSALTTYLGDLRAEIAGTEKHDWRVALHAQEDALKRVIERLGTDDD